MPNGYKLKRIMMRPNGVEKQVRPDNKWKPGADTVAYYPLTSASTVNDMSGNGYTLYVQNTSPTFGTYQGVDCAYFNGSNNGLYNTSININTFGDNATFSFWMYSGGSGYRLPFCILQGGFYGLCLEEVYWGTYRLVNGRGSSSVEIITGIPAASSQRYHVAITRVNGATFSIYVNNELKGTNNIGGWGAGATLSIGERVSEGWYVGGMSELIIEKKVWTEEERTNYFNLVKAKYGL